MLILLHQAWLGSGRTVMLPSAPTSRHLISKQQLRTSGMTEAGRNAFLIWTRGNA